MTRLPIFTLTVCIAGGSASAQELIVNGSFEDNEANETMYNMANFIFDDTVNNATAFGDSSEIDLISFDSEFGFDAVDGAWSLALHLRSEGFVDAFSLDLSSSIVAGTEYDLSFWATANTIFAGVNQPLEIGISDSPMSFGTPVFDTGLLSIDNWALHQTSFVAPIGGDYLTVRNVNEVLLSTWAQVDGFSLMQVPAPGSLALLGAGVVLGGRRRRAA